MLFNKHLTLAIGLLFYSIICSAQPTVIKTLLKRVQDKTITSDSCATIYRQLTHLYGKERQPQQALEMAQKEAAILQHKPNGLKLAEAFFNIASLYRTMAMYSKALDFANQSLSIYIKELGKEHRGSLSVYRFLAQTHYLKEDYKKAVELLQVALDGYSKQKPRDPSNEITLYILLGNFHFNSGSYPLAQESFLYAKQLYEQYSNELDTEHLAKIYSNLILLKLQQNAILEALAYCQEIVAIRKKLYKDENHFSLQSTYIQIGLCYYKLEEFEKALSFYRKSLPILNKTYGEQHDLVALLHNSLGSTFLKLNQEDSAQYHLLKSLNIYRAVLGNSSFNSVAPLWALSKLFRQQKSYIKSEICLEKGILIQQLHGGEYNPDLSKMYLDMAYLFKDQKQYAKALYYSQKAYHSNFLKERPLDKILMLQIITQQLQLSLLLSPREMLSSFNLLDKIQPTVALVQLELRSSTDQQSFILDIRHVCEQGIELCYQLYQNNPQELYLQKAFQLIEYNKAVLLSTQIKQYYHSERHAYKSSVDIEHHQKHQQVVAEIQLLEHQWEKAEYANDSIKAQELQHQLFVLHQLYEQQLQHVYKQLRYHHPIELNVLQKQLVADQSLLNFFYGSNAIYSIHLTNHSISIQKIGLDIDAPLKQFTAYLLNLDQSKKQLKTTSNEYDLLAFELYQQLIPTKTSKDLLIIPDGLLNYLPFEALTVQKTTQPKGYHELKYALSQHNISYACSATSYYYQQYKHLNQPNIELLGFAPDYHQHPYLAELKSTVPELTFLEQHFNGAYYYKNEANKVRFLEKSPLFGILHLASHGYADNNRLHQSQLFFTNNLLDSSASILQPYEIIQLPLRADLVVLSACQTAIGYWQEGEGLMSLARDFMYAGAPSVLTTLWQVNDQSSSLIIQDFYTHLVDFPKNTALQLAKQHYLKNASSFTAHPYFWSGYILMGNTNRLDIDQKPLIKFSHIGILLFVFCIIILYLRLKSTRVSRKTLTN